MKGKVIRSICPQTGLTIISKEEWTDISFGDGHRITFKLIGASIILCESSGFVTMESLKGTLNLSREIVETHFSDRPFIYMEDFSRVKSISIAGRKYYIRFLQRLKYLKMLIYFNASPLLRFSIKLAKKLNAFGFEVHATKTYKEAVTHSMNKLEITRKQLPPQRISSEENPIWDLTFENYAVRFDVHSKDILHVNSNGTFGLEHLNEVMAYQHKFIKDNFGDQAGKYYFVVNLSSVTITRECRKLYARKIQELYDELPFRSYIYYGSNRLLDVVIAFLTSFISFKVKKTRNFNDALKYIEKDSHPHNKDGGSSANEIQQYIDEFLTFLGSVDWEKDDIDTVMKKNIDHPFYQIYDAIALIKTDLNELSLMRKKNEEEKVLLKHKLQQSLKLETMGKLAGSVAHDLNNVLSGIVSYPDIILKELPDKDENAKAIKYIKRMKKSGQKAAAIVQDLLTLSRSGVVSFKPVNLNSIINEYTNSPEFKKLALNHPEVNIEYQLAKELPPISGSAIHLSKSIMNLITNAFEAITGKGKVVVSTRQILLEDKHFSSASPETTNGQYIELIVSDTGSGISKQDQPKIFEPFYSKKVMGRSGTGLGMLVIKGTVDDHKGLIHIESKEQIGTSFILYFPVTTKEPPEEIVKKIDHYTGKGESILIIDDDEDQRIIAYKILKDLYYSVKTCSSGETAIEFVKNHPVDLLVLDMIMPPGMDGLETYRQIKKINPDQKAIVVSGYSASHKVAEVQRLGAGKYLRKPYTIEDLGTAVYLELQE
jgi:signal transduction histidine kinase/CheY-like chemotaxis protein